MLVCNVSQGARRAAIAADIAETTVASDALTQGHVVFAALVDDPANVRELVNAYLGEIMVEAATAASTVNAGLVYARSVVEAATATDVAAGAVPVAGVMTEAATAADVLDGSKTAPAFSSWNSATATSVALSGSDLIATSTAAGVGGVTGFGQKTTGKYYFEVTIPVILNGCTSAIGILSSTGTYTDMVVNVTNCTEVLTNSGTIFSNGANSGLSVGLPIDGDIISVAIDLGNRKGWFRRNGGNWNGQPTHNPATNVGGVTILATVSFAPAVAFGSGHAVGDNFTGNFGQSAFSYAVPSGFTSGWPP